MTHQRTRPIDQITANIAANIQAREYALEVVDMCGTQQPQRFWECLAEMVAAKLPPKPQPVERLPAFNEQEATRFEAMPMPYGKHAGESVGEVPPDYLLFLTEGDEFSQRLKRYVKSKRFAGRQEESEDA